jgi:hypothetical protein
MQIMTEIKHLLDTHEQIINDQDKYLKQLLQAKSLTIEVTTVDGKFKVVSNIDTVLNR